MDVTHGTPLGRLPSGDELPCSGPIQWTRGDVGLKPSAAARPCALACCKWRAAAPGLKPLRLPRAPVPQGRLFFKNHQAKFFLREHYGVRNALMSSSLSFSPLQGRGVRCHVYARRSMVRQCRLQRGTSRSVSSCSRCKLVYYLLQGLSTKGVESGPQARMRQ